MNVADNGSYYCSCLLELDTDDSGTKSTLPMELGMGSNSERLALVEDEAYLSPLDNKIGLADHGQQLLKTELLMLLHCPSCYLVA